MTDLRTSLARTGRTLGVPGGVALAACILAILAIGWQAPPLFRAVVTPRPPSLEVEAEDAKRIEAFRAGFEKQLAQANGRSMFFIPPEPPPPPPPPEPDAEPQPDPPPSAYGGPAIIAMVDDTVWLADGSRLALSDEKARDIDIVSLNPPWGARLKWKGVEFDVPLFDRTTSKFLLEAVAPAEPRESSVPENQPEEEPAPEPKPQE
jgi:hypothetical protein